MSVSEKFLNIVVLSILAGGLGALAWQRMGPIGTSGTVTVNVKEPELSALAETGKAIFEANCATCHGLSAAGTENGPPLVHNIYNPGHHADFAFSMAVKFGVQQHHWSYGNMPAQPQVLQDQMPAIIKYLRELQLANGIRHL